MKRINVPFLCLMFLSSCHSQQTVSSSQAMIEPQPEERIQELFDRIQKNEKVELKLIYQAIVGPQTTLRADAARYLGTHGDESSIPHLIDALGDDSIHVGANYVEPGMATTRYWANVSLKKLTKRDFGFVWNDPKEKREEAIGRWRKWYTDTHQGTSNQAL